MESEHAFQSSVDPATAAHHRYDVLVVGAGPAGSSAAYHLARHGVDVLLVDRFAFPLGMLPHGRALTPYFVSMRYELEHPG